MPHFSSVDEIRTFTSAKAAGKVRTPRSPREVRAALVTGRAKERFQFQILEHVKFDTATGCWLYVGNLTARGYAPSHWSQRISYTLWRGVIPFGLVTDHTCEVNHCLNPWHLEPVTDVVNIAYRDRKLVRNV